MQTEHSEDVLSKRDSAFETNSDEMTNKNSRLAIYTKQSGGSFEGYSHYFSSYGYSSSSECPQVTAVTLV